MRRIAVILMILVMVVFALAGCGQEQSAGEVVNVAVLNGPTGMGAVQLMDMTEKYNVQTYETPTDIAPKLISGEVDVAALPSNMAAVLYNKTGGKVVAVTPVTLGVLYILENRAGGEAKNTAGETKSEAGIEDIRELRGRTIVSSGQGGTPEYVLQKILEEEGLSLGEDVQVQWLASHADVLQKLLSQPGTIAMIPEPFVSAALIKGNAESGKSSVKVLFDVNRLWQFVEGEELPMGELVARADFTEKRAGDLDIFLADLKASVEFVNAGSKQAVQLIVDKGFMDNADIAKAAIPGCRLICLGGDADAAEELERGAEMLKVFNRTMFEIDPEAVGGSLPGEDLYYKVK